MLKSISLVVIVLWAIVFAATAAEPPQADLARRIEAQGGYVVRASDGSISDVSLARTWATDNDVERVAEIKTIKRLNLSFTYVTDRGIERLQQLPQLEELNLDTDEFITDAATNYLRANRTLHKLILRGTDITDVGLPYLAQLTGLRSLDLSYTMIGDVGLESLPALTKLEELKLGGDRISGINLNFLKLLPKLTKLDLNGIQRRNAGACWSPLITDLDLETISQLSGLEELNLGIGISLGRTGKAVGAGNCHVSGGIKISDLGVIKLARLRNLRQLDISGAKITPAALKALSQLPLTRLSLWNCSALDDSAAPELMALSKLANLDLSYTGVGDATLQKLSALPNLKTVYLTDTKVSQSAADAWRAQKPGRFMSWAQRPAPIPKPTKKDAKPDSAGENEP
jgi:Leucine-rich repeat (LRR) protein